MLKQARSKEGAGPRSTLLSYLLRIGTPKLAALLLLGIASAAGSAAQIAATTRLMHGEVTQENLVLFGALWLGTFAALFTIQVAMNRIATQAAMAIRMDVSRKIIRADLRSIETAGSAQLLSVLSEDVSAVAAAMSAVPAIVTGLLIVLAVITYLATLAWKLLMVFLIAVAGAVFIVAIPFRRGAALTRRTTVARKGLVERFRLIIDGAKELKLDQGRRRWNEFVALPEGAAKLRDASRAAEIRFSFAQSLGQLMAFSIIAATNVIGRKYLGATVEVLAAFALTSFFLIGPLESIVARLPTLANAQAAVARIDSVGIDLSDRVNEAQHDGYVHRFERIELEEVTFKYQSSEHEFTVGPIDYVLEPGKIIFIVGGNGCGKSTFAKMLCGLYPLTGGTISVDDVPVTAQDRDRYRQLFASVFTDYCLFPELLGSGGEVGPDGMSLLAEFGLADKVKIENGRLSTRSLSTGQRKRLALLTAYLRAAPILLFDEWAADQDPAFRRVFYRKLLPELKARGKTIVAITHDEAFFDVADAIVKLEQGRIASESTSLFMARLVGAPTAPARPRE